MKTMIIVLFFIFLCVPVSSEVTLDQHINIDESIRYDGDNLPNHPTSIQTPIGVKDSGTVISLRTKEDGNTYNVSEVTGTPGFDIRWNFTDITYDANNPQAMIYIWERYDGNIGHTILFQAWNYSGSSWDTHDQITDQGEFIWTNISTTNASEYIQGGIIQMRIYHSSPGNIGHDMIFDYVELDLITTTTTTTSTTTTSTTSTTTTSTTSTTISTTTTTISGATTITEENNYIQQIYQVLEDFMLWTMKDTETCQIIADNNKNFSHVNINKHTWITDYTYDEYLPTNVYYWKVRCNREGRWSPWSEVWTFNHTNITQGIYFDWTIKGGPR